MKYGDDQCEECGGVRVTKSKLCADCLVRQLDTGIKKRQLLYLVIDSKDQELAKLEILLEAALQIGFKRNQENVKLKQHIIAIQKEIERGMKDEKDGETEDKGISF